MVKTSTLVAIQALFVAALASVSHAGNPGQQQQQQQPGNPAPTPAPTASESEECKFLRQRLEGPCQSMFAQINCADLREQWNRLCVETPKPAPTPCVVPSTPPKPTQRPFECVEGKVAVDLKGKQAILVEGEVFEFDVKLPEGANTDLPAVVTLTPSKGIALSTTSLTFNGQTDKPSYTVMAKFNPADRVPNNGKVTITADWQYPSEPDCKQGSETVSLRVKTGKAYTGKAVGDPHIKTFDGVAFDLHKPGVFKFVEGRSFQLQGAIRPCGRGRAGCVYGVAVQFGDSIVRLAVENRQLAVVKGSSSLADLTIERQKGNANQYRVFIVSDPSSYVDVKMGRWSGTEYLDVTCRASPSLVSGGLQGVLGNANSNLRDDERNTQKLIAAYMVNGVNLFTCGQADCSPLIKPAQETDKIKLDAVAILHQGYDVVAEGSIPLRASALNSRRLLRGEEHTPVRRLQQSEGEVRAMCEKVFQTVPYCTKYVKDVELYKEQLCVQDTMMVADLKNIDESKIAYLQECRRGIDEALALDTTESAAEKVEASVVRADMALADEDVCPGQCGGRGECGVTGCVCNEGFSGMACEVEIGL